MVYSIIAYSIIITGFIIFDLIPIFQQKKWKTFWIYVALISFAYATSVLYFMDIDLPSPAKPLKKLIYFVFGL